MSQASRMSPDAAFPVADVAAELRKRVIGVGDVKLHKLLFFVQGSHLAWEGTPAFRERSEAWDMGPVVAALWRDEKRGRSSTAATEPETISHSVPTHLAISTGSSQHTASGNRVAVRQCTLQVDEVTGLSKEMSLISYK